MKDLSTDRSLCCVQLPSFWKVLYSPLSPPLSLADYQHRFKNKRLVSTALQEISYHITDGLNRKKLAHKTLAVVIDLSRAFVTVNNEILIKEISILQLNCHMKKFITGYLLGEK